MATWERTDTIWGYLLHVSRNLWIDHGRPLPHGLKHIDYQPYMRFDEALYGELLERMADAGLNMLILDLGDAVKYATHPEIAVKGAWTPRRLRKELARIRKAGLEPIPKLNFSTTHDTWMGPMERKVSTPAYYDLCRDLINEVIELFDRPRFFHLGMDEETFGHQRWHDFAICRQFDLWWHDLYFYLEEVDRNGVRPWVWSDYIWHHPDVFPRKMPKSVLQSNWYYGKSFSRKVGYVDAYTQLEELGYDQVPTGSNWSCDTNFKGTVSFGKRHIAPSRLAGFVHAPWKATLPDCRQDHLGALNQVAEARRYFEK